MAFYAQSSWRPTGRRAAAAAACWPVRTSNTVGSDDDAKGSALAELLAAHAAQAAMTDELVAARERRRIAARQLLDLGCTKTWIGQQLGMSPQAVDSFLHSREGRRGRPQPGP